MSCEQFTVCPNEIYKRQNDDLRIQLAELKEADSARSRIELHCKRMQDALETAKDAMNEILSIVSG